MSPRSQFAWQTAKVTGLSATVLVCLLLFLPLSLFLLSGLWALYGAQGLLVWALYGVGAGLVIGVASALLVWVVAWVSFPQEKPAPAPE